MVVLFYSTIFAIMAFISSPYADWLSYPAMVYFTFLSLSIFLPDESIAAIKQKEGKKNFFYRYILTFHTFICSGYGFMMVGSIYGAIAITFAAFGVARIYYKGDN